MTVSIDLRGYTSSHDQLSICFQSKLNKSCLQVTTAKTASAFLACKLTSQATVFTE